MEIKYTDIPSYWPLCFLAQCSRRDACLHYQAGLVVPQNVDTCIAITPSVLHHSSCPKFTEIKTIRTAVGFRHIFSKVSQQHAPKMRSTLSAYLGGNGTYYRYLHGERALNPEQQQWIRNLFIRYGYTDEVVFDKYEERLCFDDN